VETAVALDPLALATTTSSATALANPILTAVVHTDGDVPIGGLGQPATSSWMSPTSVQDRIRRRRRTSGRFWHTDCVRDRVKGGSGLGLAIADALVQTTAAQTNGSYDVSMVSDVQPLSTRRGRRGRLPCSPPCRRRAWRPRLQPPPRRL
jgi:hypothetical protein